MLKLASEELAEYLWKGIGNKTVKHVARRLRIPQAKLEEWLAGDEFPPEPILPRLAKVLNLDLETLKSKKRGSQKARDEELKGIRVVPKPKKRKEEWGFADFGPGSHRTSPKQGAP